MRKITTGTLDIDILDTLDILNDVLESNMFSAGKHIGLFENNAAAIHGKSYGVLMNSGQSALEVALTAVRTSSAPLKVLVPATTYIATVWSIENTGNIPVFCDIDPETFCIDYNKAPDDYDIAMPVDLCGYSAGRPKDITKFVIEDAAQSFGNTECTYGDIICSSFYVSHIITTGSGGIAMFNNLEFDSFMRSYISHGRTFGGDFTKFTDEWVDRFKFNKVGVSFRGDALHAAVGLAQLKKLPQILWQRKGNANKIRALLEDAKIEGLWYPSQDYVNKCVFQFFPLVLDDNILRENVLRKLYKKGIDSRVLFNLTNQPIFQEKYGDIEDNYPVSKRINTQGFLIGCHQHITDDNICYLVETLQEVIKSET